MAAASNERTIGRRVRQVRYWRRMSLKAAADLAGISESYLSRIERGLRPVERRSLVEALAMALRVAPSELTGQPFAPTSQPDASAHSAAPALRGVLRDIEIGGPPLVGSSRSLPELTSAVALVGTACDACDYAVVGEAAPGLIADLHNLVQEHRSSEARRLLAEVLHAAFYLSKDLGHGDLAWMVAGQLYRAAQSTGDPAWGGVASFVRAHATVGTGARERALLLASNGAESLEPDDGPASQVYGMLHLSAALHSAVTDRPDDAEAHLAEAARTAQRAGEGTFAGLNFGPRNVGVWRIALALELGEPGRVPGLARAVDVAAMSSTGRQATFYCDVGRGMAAIRRREEQAVEAFRRAEMLAPQRTRNSPFVREAVTELLRRVRPDSGGRELRGMAYRMGLDLS